MHIRIILAVLLIFLIYSAISHYKTLPKNQQKKTLAAWVLYTFIAMTLLAVITGKMHWIGAVIAGLLGFAKMGFTTLLRALPFLGFLKKQTFIGTPTFKTPYLKVQIDLQSGAIYGSIIDGPHKGKSFSELTQKEIKDLEDYYKNNDQRAYYLIRVIQSKSTRKEQFNQQQKSTTFEPGYNEALQILGLKDSPSKQEVIKAHKSLMQKLHPDRGGNNFLASQINNAKEVLLRHIQ